MTGIELLSKNFAAQKDIILSNTLAENNLMVVNLNELKRRCIFAQYQDGREVLLIDGKATLEFLPAEIIQRDNRYFFEQKYRRI